MVLKTFILITLMPTLICISLNSCEIQHFFIYLFICHLDFCFHGLIVVYYLFSCFCHFVIDFKCYLCSGDANPVIYFTASIFYLSVVSFFFSRLILLLTLCLRKKVCCPVGYSNWKGKSDNVWLSLFRI